LTTTVRGGCFSARQRSTVRYKEQHSIVASSHVSVDKIIQYALKSEQKLFLKLKFYFLGDFRIYWEVIEVSSLRGKQESSSP
jgi:hypothetical protein